MIPDIVQLLQVYMVPFAIGVPIVLLLFFFGSRWTAEPALPVVPNRVPAVPVKNSVLVVDDSAVVRAKLKRLFEGQGYRVETANDGSQALDALSKSHISVIVTDLEMPVMNGFELITAVQSNMETDDIPIIAVTGDEELHGRVNDCKGLFGIFKKPWNDRDLLKRVETLSTLRKQSSTV